LVLRTIRFSAFYHLVIRRQLNVSEKHVGSILRVEEKAKQETIRSKRQAEVGAIAQAVSRWLPTAAARVRARVWQMEFVVDKVALGQVFYEYFGFPCQSSFHQIIHHHNHPGQVQICHSVADVPSGLSSTPNYAKATG
jgi:hypothetical protein